MYDGDLTRTIHDDTPYRNSYRNSYRNYTLSVFFQAAGFLKYELVLSVTN